MEREAGRRRTVSPRHAGRSPVPQPRRRPPVTETAAQSAAAFRLELLGPFVAAPPRARRTRAAEEGTGAARVPRHAGWAADPTRATRRPAVGPQRRRAGPPQPAPMP